MEDEFEGQGLEGNNDNVQGQETGTDSINPAWNDVLSVIPKELHSQVTPHFSKWDQNYQSGIQKVHSQYEPYKPYVEEGLDPQQINYAMSVLQAIETNPQEVMTALQSYMGLDSDEQGQEDDENTDNGSQEQPEWLNHPEFQRVNEMVNTMAELLVQQRQSEVDAQEDEALDSEISAAKQTHGDFDEEWVLSRMYTNPELSVEEAVQAYKSWETSVLEKARKPGPKVLGPGGSAPSSDLNPKELDSKGKRNLIAQILAQQNQNQ